jgi:hypothetical protein
LLHSRIFVSLPSLLSFLILPFLNLVVGSWSLLLGAPRSVSLYFPLFFILFCLLACLPAALLLVSPVSFALLLPLGSECSRVYPHPISALEIQKQFTRPD